MADKQQNRIETVGNPDTMNLHNILYVNIIASPYFKALYEKKTYHEVVDEIYNNEPFFKGNHASTAFCLLYKLWTLKLTIKQIEGLIDHTDSPYIRALGFLYLRYVCKPADLWDWFGDYLDDEEEMDIERGVKPRKMTIGQFCRHLLTDPKWLGTILPRIPVPIARDLDKKLKETPPIKPSSFNASNAAPGPGGAEYTPLARPPYNGGRDGGRDERRDDRGYGGGGRGGYDDGGRGGYDRRGNDRRGGYNKDFDRRDGGRDYARGRSYDRDV
ncbi:PRP38 pre-mRNA processing factor 38 domain-containing protein B, partial [Rhizophlyctis rosea]